MKMIKKNLNNLDLKTILPEVHEQYHDILNLINNVCSCKSDYDWSIIGYVKYLDLIKFGTAMDNLSLPDYKFQIDSDGDLVIWKLNIPLKEYDESRKIFY